jgi:hypothetical protein
MLISGFQQKKGSCFVKFMVHKNRVMNVVYLATYFKKDDRLVFVGEVMYPNNGDTGICCQRPYSLLQSQKILPRNFPATTGNTRNFIGKHKLR